MRTRLTLLACALAVVASAGTAAADERADAILDKVEEQLYSPRGAGLKTARCEVSTPLSAMLGRKVKIMLYWQAGDGDMVDDRTAIKAVGELPKMVKPSFVAKIAEQVTGLAASVFASPLAPIRSLRAHADVTVEKDGSDRVITFVRQADAPASVTLEKAVVVVDRKDRLESIATTKAGATLTLTPQFNKRGGALRLTGYTARLDEGKRKGKSNRVAVKWRKARASGEEIQVPQELTSRSPRVSVKFEDYVLNEAIPAGVFPDEKQQPDDKDKPGGGGRKGD